MIRTLAIAGLAAGVTLAVAQAAPQPISIRAGNAGELAELCGANPREPAADAKINFCHGFAQGALDVERKRAEEQKRFCFPSNAPSRRVVMGEFVNWVRAMPDRRNMPSADALFSFFGERFPCK